MLKKFWILMVVLLLVGMLATSLAHTDDNINRILLVCPDKMEQVECDGYIRRTQ